MSHSWLCCILGNVVLDCVVLGCVVLACVVLDCVVLDSAGVPFETMVVCIYPGSLQSDFGAVKLIKQINLNPDPQNNVGSTGSSTLVWSTGRRTRRTTRTRTRTTKEKKKENWNWNCCPCIWIRMENLRIQDPDPHNISYGSALLVWR